jgi:hypothetical protein
MKLSFEARFILSFFCMIAYFPGVYSGLGTINAVVSSSVADNKNFFSKFYTSIGDVAFGDLDLFYTKPSDIRDTLDFAQSAAIYTDFKNLKATKEQLNYSQLSKDFNAAKDSATTLFESLDYQKIINTLSEEYKFSVNMMAEPLAKLVYDIDAAITENEGALSTEVIAEFITTANESMQDLLTTKAKDFTEYLAINFIDDEPTNIFNKISAGVDTFFNDSENGIFNDNHVLKVTSILDTQIYKNPNKTIGATKLASQALAPK